MQAASEETGSLKRLLLVTAFNIAQWADDYERLKFLAVRPAPLETFEFVHPPTGCKVLVEHVRLHTLSILNKCLHAIQT